MNPASSPAMPCKDLEKARKLHEFMLEITIILNEAGPLKIA
jgi:hypothetical protein